ncbi:PLP-dependent aminotransferase family protein [Paenibacillus sp. TRM 82003]|nr:PLP-dependent aminotransferase family protein [Paenibacillus sp. TRM 82003]
MVWITVDRSSDASLTNQILSQLRGSILRAELTPGAPLPSTRQLATDLDVSRNIVLEVYDQLTAEGYLESRRGRGTFVAEGAQLTQRKPSPPPASPPVREAPEDVVSFRSGIPALDQFPRRKWAQLAQQVLLDTSTRNFGYDAPEGRQELRSAIAKYVFRIRGVSCHPDQIVITSGATQAISLAAKCCVNPGAPVILEDPITRDIQTILASHGAHLVPLPVDDAGLDPAELADGGHRGCVYVTPSHQYPLGSILPIPRRVQLIEYARRTGSYIIEDDYDSEFRHEGAPIPSLQGLDPDVVLYIGTFSKILSPALRIGYLILPEPLIERCRRLKWFSDLHTPSLDQLVLARFIEEGWLERHIRKMKKMYKRRRDIAKGLLGNTFGDRVRVSGDATGLHLIAEFKGLQFTEAVLERIRAAGVYVQPVEMHAMRKGRHAEKLIIGFGNLTEAEMREGFLRMRTALADTLG